MKKILSITLLTIFAISYSQAQTFAPEGSKWTFCTFSGYSGTGILNYDVTSAYLKSSYELEGKQISIIEAVYDSEVFEWHFYTNQDTTFIFSPTENKFTLFLNFSFNKGDTLVLNKYNTTPNTPYFHSGCDTFLLMRVDSIGTLFIDDLELKFYTLEAVWECKWENKYTNPNFRYKLIAVEKLGYLGSDKIDNTSINVNFNSISYILPEILDLGLHDGSTSSLQRFEYDQNSIILTLDNCLTSINHFGYNSYSINIFPNPVLENLQVISQNEDLNIIQILDITGNVIYSEKVNLINHIISFTNYRSGVYFLKLITTENKTYIHKILKI